MQPAWMQEAVAQAAAAAPIRAEVLPQRQPGLELHVDGDYLAYFAGGNDDCAPDRAKQNALDKMDALRAMSGADKIVVHLTARGSDKGERYLIATVQPYQGKRNNSRRPKNWEFLRAWMEGYTGSAFKVLMWHDREADDGMAYCATRKEIVVGSADKDMRQFPGLHCNWSNYILTRVRPCDYSVVGEDGLLYGPAYFWQQMLQGDTADNIPGLPLLNGRRCGEVTAQKYLAGIDNNQDALLAVYDAYYKHYGEQAWDMFLEQACLLWLRRNGADLDDFWWWLCEQGLDSPGLNAAMDRLDKRVEEQRATLDSIASGSLPH